MVLERFPLELRVDLDMLSRQRNILNQEQQKQIFRLLGEYGINDAVPLGMGTNRYGFKLGPYAVKYATNNDGRIDNLMEFRMSKSLQPHVIRVHEVMSNGLLMVCEYITPFNSYHEMIRYEDPIRRMLGKLSDFCLIGDLGISEINFGNLGLRVGNANDPVALDFAYAIPVSSTLFTCSVPGCNGTLVPSSNYVRLQCMSCNKTYSFEELRVRISRKDIEALIGDPGDIGYRLTESNVDTVLDESRSTYLTIGRKKDKKSKRLSENDAVPTEEDTVPIDDFAVLTKMKYN